MPTVARIRTPTAMSDAISKAAVKKIVSTANPTSELISNLSQALDPDLKWLLDQITRGKTERFMEVHILTPLMASYLLNHNTDNRTLNPIKVKEISQNIESDQFEDNGETVIIAKDGMLNDGQNRCQAIVNTKKMVTTGFSFGTTRQSRFTIDIGKIRTSGNFLSMHGVRNSNRLSAVINLLLYYRSGHYVVGPSLSFTVTKPEIDDYYMKHSKELEAAVQFIGREPYVRDTGFYVPILTAYLILSQIDKTAAEEFVQGVISGASQNKTDARLRCHNHFPNAQKFRLRNWERLELLLRYWNTWRRGGTLSRNVSLEGEYPKVLK